MRVERWIKQEELEYKNEKLGMRLGWSLPCRTHMLAQDRYPFCLA